MCQRTFIWCELSLCRGNISIYKLNLNFGRLLIITWRIKCRLFHNLKFKKVFDSQIMPMSLWRFPCVLFKKILLFLPFLSLSDGSDSHWNGTEYIVTKQNIKTLKKPWDLCIEFQIIFDMTFFANDTISLMRTLCHF